MPRQRSKKLSEGRKAFKQPTSPAQDEREQDGSDKESVDIMEKDEDEQELEKLVLGDEAGFMAHLDHGDAGYEDEDLEEEEDLEAEVGLDVEEILEDVDDAEVGPAFVYIISAETDYSYSCFSLMLCHPQ
jgi:U3 small nucleolar RNA-associated protein 18